MRPQPQALVLDTPVGLGARSLTLCLLIVSIPFKARTHTAAPLCHSTYVEAKGQLPGVSFLPLCGPLALNSGHQAWGQAP